MHSIERAEAPCIQGDNDRLAINMLSIGMGGVRACSPSCVTALLLSVERKRPRLVCGNRNRSTEEESVSSKL